MSDFPVSAQPVTDTHLTCGSSIYGPRFQVYISTAMSAASADWVSGVAVYIPFSLPHPYLVSRVFWANGSVPTATSVDMGIYTADGTLIYSTTPTAMTGGGTNLQYAVVTAPFTLHPGRYYLAWTCNNTTSRAYGYTITTANGRLVGLLQQSSVPTLPATATFAAYAGTIVPYCGLTRTSTGF